MRQINIFKIGTLLKTITICLWSLPFIIRAEHQKYLEKPSVAIEIIVSDSTMLKDAEIQFEISQDGINSLYVSSNKTYTYKLTGARTKLAIPLSTAVNYGRIVYRYNKDKIAPFLQGIDNLFIFENGDDLDLVLSKKSFLFKGNGSGKYNYLRAIGKPMHYGIKGANKQASGFYKVGNYEGWIQGRIQQIDSLFAVFADTLKEYKSKVSPAVFHQLETDNWAMYNFKVINLLITKHIGRPDSNYNKAFVKVFRKIFADFNPNRFDDAALAQSYHYADYSYLKAAWSTTFTINDAWLSAKKQYTFKDMYPNIQKNTAGLLKDKLMLVAFSADVISRPDCKDFIGDAIKSMGNNKYRENLEKLERTLMNVFPFELPDAEGKIHKLADFRDKLIVMDFWYTGCMPCRVLADAMKPIVRSYRGNSNVVFITVSIDGSKNKDMWLKSLREETYSSKDGINLLAVEGKESEIIKYYNILGYPTIFLISKDGKMITTQPPRPAVDEPERNAAFKALIDRYL